MEIIFYAIFQKTLDEINLLNEDGSPKKAKNEDDRDIIFLYEYFSSKVVKYSQEYMSKKAKEFNSKANKLHDDYLLNMTLMGLFMVDKWLIDQDRFTQNLIQPKVNRSIKRAHKIIKEKNSEGSKIITDSSYAASNMVRLYNNKPELTKDIRKARVDMWKKAFEMRQK